MEVVLLIDLKLLVSSASSGLSTSSRMVDIVRTLRVSAFTAWLWERELLTDLQHADED